MSKRFSSALIVLISFVAAAGLCILAAGFLVRLVESRTEISVRHTLDTSGFEWAEVEANGLAVTLSGTARDEAARFASEQAVGRVVDPTRIINTIEVTPTAGLAAPRFSAEILRNDTGISVIGLIPADTDRDALIAQMQAISGDAPVTDLLETASYPEPEGWSDSVSYAVSALSRLPRSKVSVNARRVSITAIADSKDAKAALENDLTRSAPPGVQLAMNISAPRPVITPFTLRYQIDESGGRFDACSADTDATRTAILEAAQNAGLQGDARCTIGLGVPSPRWVDAARASLSALAELGGGTVTMADADITLVAVTGTSPVIFDRVIGELETALPEVFALHAVLPVPESVDGSGPPEFIATLSPEGLVQLRGRLNNENLRLLADSYAKSRFGSDNVYTATRQVSDLPQNWPVRVLASLEALSFMANGSVTVTPDTLTLRGVSFDEDASDKISGLLSDKLGEAESFSLDVTYRKPPPPKAARPDPEVCEAELVTIQQASKITFEPGSATIDEASQPTMDRIAALLTACGEIKLEIQGHTDSQGRTSMNQELSQQRAQSVLDELRERRVLTSSYIAKGYGEALPIASNKTEEGREENRRIEFRLIRPEPTAEDENALDAIAESNASGAAEAQEAGAEGAEN